MDRHERAGTAANIAAFILTGCLISGLADEALKDKCSPQDADEIKAELEEIASDLTAKAQYHKSMGRAIRVKGGSEANRG